MLPLGNPAVPRGREQTRPMWKLSIEDDQGQQTVVNLVRDEYSIGRGEENTIRLTERNISRRHALLVRERDQWFLEDLQSYNGAFVNGVRIGGRQELAHGDLVQLGDYRIELMDEALATREQGHRRMPTDPFLRRDSLIGQPDRFVMLIGPTQGAEFPLDGERMVIGRGDECDICINHASVSRVHAEVRRLGNGRYELVDKGSANGVRVNGADLERALLDARDVIELGDVVLKFIPAGDIFRADGEDSKRYTLAAFNAPGGRDTSRLDPRVVAAAAGVVLLALALALVWTRSPTPGTTVASAEVSPEASALEEAVRLVEDGDVFGAHERLRSLPDPSAIATAPEFRRIEAEWADAMLQAALGETDPAKKRAILDEVARTPSVDAQRRGLAAKALSALSASPTVGLDELDSAGPSPQVSATTASALREADPEELEEQAEALDEVREAPKPLRKGTTTKATTTSKKNAKEPPAPAPLPSGDEPW